MLENINFALTVIALVCLMFGFFCPKKYIFKGIGLASFLLIEGVSLVIWWVSWSEPLIVNSYISICGVGTLFLGIFAILFGLVCFVSGVAFDTKTWD